MFAAVLSAFLFAASATFSQRARDAMIPAQLDGVIRADDQIAKVLAGEIARGEVVFLRPTGVLCQAGRCRAYARTTPFAVDYGHLTVEGAVAFVGLLAAADPALWAAVPGAE